MRRLDVVPNEDTLTRLLEIDPIGRNEELASFAQLLREVEGGFTFFVDSGWGSGKTYFVKQLKMLLEASNDKIRSSSRLDKLICSGRFDAFRSLPRMLPVYYNAWENDYWDDPLPSLGAAIASVASEEADFGASAPMGKTVSDVLDALLFATLHLNGVSKLYDDFKPCDLVKSYHEKGEIRDRISELILRARGSCADKLVLIIDELDRCRPDFALRILEELKNAFNDESLIIIYALNMRQLAHSVERAYGTGTDGIKYLSKFYDMKISLCEIDSYCYIKTLGVLGEDNYRNITIRDVVSYYDMSMRETNQFVQKLSQSHESTFVGGSTDAICAFLGGVIAPVLIAMELVDSDAYEKVRYHFDSSIIMNVISECPNCNKVSEALIDRIFGSTDVCRRNAAVPSIDLGTQLMNWLLVYLWNTDRRSTVLQEAHFELVSRDADSNQLDRIRISLR